MTSSTLIAFILTSLIMDFTPGPAVLKVVGDSMSHGWKKTQPSIAGILSANAMYCMLSALGLSALIFAMPALFDIIKWVGVAYLGYLGLAAIYAALFSSEGRVAPSPLASPKRLFTSSFVLQGANPKSFLYFAAILPAFAGSGEDAPFWIIVLGILSVSMEYPVLVLYSLLGGTIANFATRGAGRRIIDAVAGIAVIGAAAMIARTSLQHRGG